jgi:hypothetical protein
MAVSGQLHATAALTLRKPPVAHWIGDWVGPRAGLDASIQDVHVKLLLETLLDVMNMS